MNKIFFGALCAAAMLSISSCSSSSKVTKVEDLDGNWQIAKVNGKSLPDNMENKPFIQFNVKESRIHGNAGCNIFNGKFRIKRSEQNAISFPNTVTTMMSCPDLSTEQEIMTAINSVESYKKRGKGFVFYNSENKKVLKIKR